MAKKANAPRPPAPARAPPIPNKELIQRMNFLHQASALLSSAIYNPAAAKPSSHPDSATAAKAKEKQKETNKVASSMQLLDTQPPPVASTSAWTASVPPPYLPPWAYPDPYSSFMPYVHDPYFEEDYADEGYGGWLSGESDNMLAYVDRARAYDARVAERQRLQDLLEGKQSKAKGFQETPKQKRAQMWRDQGLSDEQIKVRERRIEQRQARRDAKAKLPPLVVGHVGGQSKEDARISKLDHITKENGLQAVPGTLTKFLSGARDKLKHQPQLLHLSQLENRNLSNHYVADIRSIAKKSVMRIDPNVKRTMCRNCNALLIPGITASIRVKPSKTHVHTISTRCTACNVTRQIPAPPIMASETEPGEQAQESVSNASRLDVDMHPSQPNSSDGPSRDSAMSISSSRTPSEESVIPEAGVTPVQIVNAGGHSNRTSDSSVNARAYKSKRKYGNGVSAKPRKRKKQHFDPIVPGTRGQYARLRFQEKPEHAVTIVSST